MATVPDCSLTQKQHLSRDGLLRVRSAVELPLFEENCLYMTGIDRYWCCPEAEIGMTCLAFTREVALKCCSCTGSRSFLRVKTADKAKFVTQSDFSRASQPMEDRGMKQFVTIVSLRDF